MDLNEIRKNDQDPTAQQFEASLLIRDIWELNPKSKEIEAVVSNSDGQIAIAFAGYGCYCDAEDSEDPPAPVVLIDVHRGHPELRAYADITSADATHVITFKGARLPRSFRRCQTEDCPGEAVSQREYIADDGTKCVRHLCARCAAVYDTASRDATSGNRALLKQCEKCGSFRIKTWLCFSDPGCRAMPGGGEQKPNDAALPFNGSDYHAHMRCLDCGHEWASNDPGLDP